MRGKDVQEINELKRAGLSIRAISQQTGLDRKTIRKYLLDPAGRPAYGPRAASTTSKLEDFKPYLEARLKAGVWNASVLLRELRQRNYAGGYTILTDWLRPQRESARVVAVRRFETAPGKQAQVDWGHLGSLTENGKRQPLWGFAMTLGYSRRMMAQAATDTRLGTLLRMHELAFEQWGGVPEELLYDRMRTIWTGTDERGEIIWNSTFLDFARYWGFTPRLCRPYRAQTKGKVESGVKYVRRNFLCGLQGREPSSLVDLNNALHQWVAEVANQRVHGTTHEQVLRRWDGDRFGMQSCQGRVPYPYAEDESRKVARDAYVSWQASRYSVPWIYAGKEVSVREHADQVEVRCGGERIALHARATGQHQVITLAAHHQGIPLSNNPHSGKTLVHIRHGAPVVENRSLAAYEAAAMDGVR
jgi:transposase